MRPNRLTLFNHLWAIAGFCEWTRWTWTETGFSWVLLAASVTLWVFPNSIAALCAFALTHTAFTALAANAPWNHGLAMALMDLAILVSIARVAFERRRAGAAAGASETVWSLADRERLVETFAPAVRSCLVLLYLFAFFHKLNVDFLDPDVSCAGFLLGRVNTTYRILPTGEWTVIMSIWGTLFVELGIPLLLLCRRTVYAALGLGILFHGFLSQHGALYGFAAMLFAVYSLFLPKSFASDVAERFESLIDRFDLGHFRAIAMPISTALLLLGGRVIGDLLEIDYLTRGKLAWDAWILGVVVVLSGPFVKLMGALPENGLRPRWAPLWIIPILFALNGTSPYFGLKTETSWSMYSNLRTETRSNHLIVPESAKLFDYQHDLVEIVETSDRRLQYFIGPDVRIPLLEFRHRCGSISQDFFVRYRHGEREGIIRRVDGIVTGDTELCSPPPWLLEKLLRFRPVDIGERTQCRH